jgi:DHA2 family multidrug resistance protein
MSAILMPFVGKMIGKVDTRAIIGAGSVVIGFSMFMLASMNINSNWNSLFWPLLVRGIGPAGMFIPLSVATLGPIPKNELGMASGFFNLMRQIGGSIGVAVLATMLSKRQEFHFDRLREQVSIYSPTAQHYYSQAQQMLVFKGFDTTSAQKGALSLLERITQLHSMILAFKDAYIFVGVMFFISLPLIFLLGSGAHTRRKAAPKAAG